MAIDALTFGKNLRPSTVDTMNKLNEVINAVNAFGDTSEYGERITQLETQMTTANQNISNLQTATSGIDQIQSDVDDIKTTLYTPIADSSDTGYDVDLEN